VQAGGTAPSANLGAWPTRGKTGTTNDYVDAWFVGMVKQLATATWIGFPNGTRFYVDADTAQEQCGERAFLTQCPPARATLENVTIAGTRYARVFGGTLPAPMWKRYMAAAVEPYEQLDFPAAPPRLAGFVPDVINAFDAEDARLRAQLAGYNLRFQTVLDASDEGTLLGQAPEAGTRLELGRMIVVFVSGGPFAAPTLPDLIGVSEATAIARLEALGYLVELVGTRIGDPLAQKPVLSMSPAAGTPLDPGNVVRLEIGVYDPALDPAAGGTGGR
jgi:hypothetical protein